MSKSSIAIRRTVKGAVPAISFEKIARSILGANYELSLVLCGDTLARRMNRTYRKKEYAPNVLSFPYSPREGEIFLNIRKAEREARAMGTSPRKRATLLFVHGCFHLKGLKHGERMEAAERRVLKRFELL